jgi:predicted DNA-binding protein (MmcQ/YjbR family)
MTATPNARTDLVPVPIGDLKVEAIEGELLLYHPRQTKAVYLNPTAAVIWSLCDGHRSVHEIIELIGESYPDAKPTLTEEVLSTLRVLEENGLMVVA